MIATDAGKNTCLHVAVAKGHVTLANELLDWARRTMDVPQFVNMTRSHGDTPLHIAASNG